LKGGVIDSSVAFLLLSGSALLDVSDLSFSFAGESCLGVFKAKVETFLFNSPCFGLESLIEFVDLDLYLLCFILLSSLDSDFCAYCWCGDLAESDRSVDNGVRLGFGDSSFCTRESEEDSMGVRNLKLSNLKNLPVRYSERYWT